jgi:mRNA interferase MazF
VRPVLVVQNDTINRFATTVLAIPLTTNLRRSALPSCVLVAKGQGGLTCDSVLLCHQLRALDVGRLRDKLGEVSEEIMIAVEACLVFTLGIRLGA